jgi:TRAP transporter 4TM/12TM fusion protein
MSVRLNYEIFQKKFMIAFGILIAVIHIGQFTFNPMESIKFYAWHLMLGLVVIFLRKPGASKTRIVWDWLLAAASVFIGLSVILNYDRYSMMMQNGRTTPYFYFLGILLSLLSLEAARRVIGTTLPAVAVVCVLYALFGGNLPGLLGHRGYPFERVITTIFSDQGIYGTPIGVSASTVYLFLLFAAFLSVSGADAVFQNFAVAATGRKRGGPAKMAVVASALFGSISGSAVANVVSTGSFTIPLMKKQGYSGSFAGAVEAVASTGGQFMPPIMGAAAFVLSDIAATPYIKVCAAATLPALMYYLTLFKMVDLEAVRQNLRPVPPESIPSLKEALRGSFKLIVPILVLLFFLLVYKTTPMLAAIYSMGAIVVCGFLSRSERLGCRKIAEGFAEGARNLPQVVASCACAGIVVAMFALTGIGLKFSNFVMRLGEISIWLSLFLSMTICFVLGTGLPTTAAYIICATALAPALIKGGVAPLSAHLFLLYFASISSITPPVAVASYAAASIAEENALKVSLSAVKLGIAGFLLPFTFVLDANYLHFGFDMSTLFTWISAFVVCYSAAIAIQGFVEQKISLSERALYAFIVATAIQPGYGVSFLGWALFGALYIRHRYCGVVLRHLESAKPR